MQSLVMAASDDFFEKRSACEKQELLWNAIVNTQHQTMPELATMGPGKLFAMSWQFISKKRDHIRDFAPPGWEKYLHKRGVIAKTKFIATNDHPFTGVFKGAECNLLRLSLTYRPEEKPGWQTFMSKKDPDEIPMKRGFAPGLAWKVFRDAEPSVNISALYTLDGQNRNYNFMANPLSNIVPRSYSIGLKISRKIFSRITSYPEELLVNEFAEKTPTGEAVDKPIAPRQIFFVPNPKIQFSDEEHDFREDFLELPAGTELYTVIAASADQDDFPYGNYKTEDISTFVSNGTEIGKIVTQSEFLASEFGDTGIFFRHEVRPKKVHTGRRARIRNRSKNENN